jgi:hypothetical protein
LRLRVPGVSVLRGCFVVLMGGTFCGVKLYMKLCWLGRD